MTGYSSFQSSQTGGSSEEFDILGENCEDDDSHDTPSQFDEAADPLFKPALSLPTRDTQTSGSRAPDIKHFFVVYGKDKPEEKRVCKICG